MSIIVHGHGQSSKLMVVGDYPSQKDILAQKAFSDSTEWTLAQMMAPYNVRFGELYKTLYYKEPIPQAWIKEKDKRKKAKIELPDNTLHAQVLTQELKAIKPMSILSCGELALNFLTGEKGIDKFRGSLLPLRKDLQASTGLHHTVVIPCIHPRDLNTQYNARPYTQLDVGRSIEYTQKRYISPEGRYNIWVCRTPEQLRNYLNRQFHNAPFYTTDIETFLGFITCIGFCFDGKEAISVPLMELKSSIEERAELFKIIDQVYRSDKPKLNQNIKYDQHVSEHWGFIYENIMDDTMLRAHSMYPELPKGLDFLASIHTDIPYYKDEGKEFDPSLHEKDQLYLYNAKDCLADWIVYKSQVADCKAVTLWPGYTLDDFHKQKVFPLYSIYRKIDKAGIRVDSARKDQLYFKYDTLFNTMVESISTAVGFDYNPNSTVQAAKIIYDYLNMPPIYKKDPDTKGQKKLATDKESIEELILNKVDLMNMSKDAKEDAKQLLGQLLTVRHLDTALEWLRSAEHPNGKMYTNTKLTGTKSTDGSSEGGTKSGRTSASSTVDYAWGVVKKSGQYKIGQINLGMSFQTVPKHGKQLPDGTRILNDLTSIFVPDNGWIFLEGDKSQAEARVVIVLANAQDTLHYFDKPNDVHCLTTSWITKIDYDLLLKVRKEKGSVVYQGKPIKVEDLRQALGKPGRHAANFDMEAFRLSLMAHIPQTEAKEILNQIHDAEPRIRNVFHAEVRKCLEKNRRLINPYGRIRDFFDRFSNKLWKEAYSYLPQSTISDHVKFDILTPLSEKYEKYEVQCLNEKHDSLLFHLEKEMRDDFAGDFINFGSTPIDFSRGSFVRADPLLIPTDVNWSDTNWKEMKEWKNG